MPLLTNRAQRLLHSYLGVSFDDCKTLRGQFFTVQSYANTDQQTKIGGDAHLSWETITF